jgi:hypothetical protein
MSDHNFLLTPAAYLGVRIFAVEKLEPAIECPVVLV